jgi:hypothetical protein
MGGYGEGPSGSSYYSSRSHTATLSSSPKPEQPPQPYAQHGYQPYSYPPQQQQYGLNPAYNAMYVQQQQQQQYPPLPASSYPGSVIITF